MPLSVEQLLGKKAERAAKSADERRAVALRVSADLVDEPEGTSADDALEALVEAVNAETVGEIDAARWVEELSTAQIKKFGKEWRAEYGAAATDVKVDDQRAATVAYAENLVDREKATAETALDALRVAVENDPDVPDEVKAFMAGPDGKGVSKRQARRFGRDWRREQSSPTPSGPRRNRFDELEAKIDGLTRAVEELTAALSKKK